MEFLLLCLFGLSGILTHIVLNFRDELTKTSSIGTTVKERLLLVWANFDILGMVTYAVFALILVVICVALRDKLINVGFPVTELTIIGVGYMADSALKNIMPENK